jgi:hypothetical protein
MNVNKFEYSALFEGITYAPNYAYRNKLGDGADIYSVIGSPLLTELEEIGIEAEIKYAGDIDAKWLGQPSREETKEALKKLCPKLYALFNREEPPGRAPDAPIPTGGKESVLEKIKQGRQNRQAGQPPDQQQGQKPRNTKKPGPEK